VVSIFGSLGGRSRAEQAALAHERLRALVSSAVEPKGWVPPPDDGFDQIGPDRGARPDAAARTDALPASADWAGRLRVSPLAVVGLVALLVTAVVLAGLFAWRGRARDVGGELAPPQAPQSVATSAAVGGQLVVDVAGRVRRPGLVTLPPGSRVADAIRAAGGVRPGTDLTSLNLARKLVDGEQILVGVAGAAAPTSGGSPGPTNPINLNTATAAELDQLPGVGPVLAQRIIDWRTAHGSFTSVSQLRQVTGIGDSKYADLQSLVRV
jgi:competence protein ComEA